MDEFQKLDVKIPNSVLVEGISDEDGKEEVFDFLKQYGKITKTEIISEADSEFEGQFVVEFSSGTAVAELRSILPYSFKSSEKSDTFFISELAVVYAEHVSQSKTHSYLFELQKLAKLSGMDFAEVLKSTMTQIGQSVAELHSAAKMEDPDEKSEVMAAAADPTMKEEPTLSTATDPTVSRQRLEQQPTSRQRPSLHDDDIQPPEVQRYVVEHIMKTEESAYHLQRLRVFSGRLPRPAHEADYETWHSGVDLLLKDPSVSELQRSRRIVESLLPPAADMLKHLSSDTPPTVYLNILDSAYGTVQDGEELFAKFMDTFQDAGEKPSSYLQRLQVEGAAGQSVPYLGYVELVITFPEDFIGVNTEVDLQEQQQADPAIREVIHQLETGEKVLPSVREELSDLPLLLREWNRLELVDGILYRRRHDGDKLIYQLILPPKLRPTVLKSLHHDMGHMGIERTIDLVRQRFFWPKMTLEVETFVRTCGRCIRRKAQIERAAPLINIQTSRPLELLCMDFLTIEPDSSNTKDILVLTDHFTKFAVAIPTPNQKAKTVAKYLWNEFMVYYGIPERIHSDQGTDFESKLIKELCEVVGMKKSRTTPYHPRGNPVERFNRTLLNMLGTLEMKQKSKWREYVKPLVHAYNCTRNVVTGFTPYELMFGRCPRLPVDLAFGLPVREQSSISHSEYVKNLQSSLKESYKLASENALKSAAKNKTRFDQKITPCSLEIGDRVLVRNIRLRGKHKLADRWEPGVYKVVNRAENVPVYTVQPEHKEGPTRTLHRDLLLPCGFLPVCSTEDPSISMPASQRKTRSQDGCHPDVPDAMQEDEDAEPYVPEVSIPSPTRFSVKVRKFESSPESITLQPISPLAQSDAEAPEHPVPLIQSTDLETASPSENEKSCLTTDSSLSHYEDKLPVEQIEAEELSEPHVAEPVKVHMEGEVPDEHLPEVQEPDAEGHLVVQSESSIGPASVSSPYNSNESETLPRRSDRQRQPPSRLTYPVLGQVRCRSLAQGVAGGILTIARIVWFHRPDWRAKISRIPKHKTYHLGTFFRPNWRISSSPH
ncbi:uncharacterized protein LOC111610011 [Xiphophorus maculatus]|uniref:uncharacterized protein LOC111610011 n=1 Tax=Xiphophorus maculatus TaxID=8083 RepID=UPI000C6E6EAD|nr:uncharacterized protein LOC111610011 [Xiphophorus maculatus]